MKKQINSLFITFLYSYLVLSLFVQLGLAVPSNSFRLGIENVNRLFVSEVLNKPASAIRVGLVTNQTGKDQQGNRTVDVLLQKGLRVKYLFAPEHGFSGKIEAGNTVTDEIDASTKIPIVSLYVHGAGRKIDVNRMQDIDVLMYDLQDCGMRHYTYISLLLRVMEAALECNKPLIVLDRPNPLGGLMEGPLVEPDLISFISIAPIPVRHGMTIGELAHYFNHYMLKEPIALHVIKMSNYNRGTHQFTMLAPLSPNIATLESLGGYSFLGLLGEIAPFNVGVGTPDSFQIITLPISMDGKWLQVQQLLKHAGLESTIHTHYVERKKQHYKGLKLVLKNKPVWSSLAIVVALLTFFKKEGIPLQFSASFDKAMGSSQLQKMINAGAIDNTFLTPIKNNLDTFYIKAFPTFLYQPHPYLSQ